MKMIIRVIAGLLVLILAAGVLITPCYGRRIRCHREAPL